MRALVLLSLVAGACAPVVTVSPLKIRCDLDGDGVAEEVTLLHEETALSSAHRVRVTRGGALIAEAVTPGPAQRIAAAQLVGDAACELVVTYLDSSPATVLRTRGLRGWKMYDGQLRQIAHVAVDDERSRFDYARPGEIRASVIGRADEVWRWSEAGRVFVRAVP